MAVAAKGGRLVQGEDARTCGGAVLWRVARDGEMIEITWGRAFQVAPGFDAAIERRLDRFWDRYYGIGPASFGVPGDIAGRPQRFATVPCQT